MLTRQVPSWHRFVHQPAEDSFLFAYSDRAMMDNLGLYQVRLTPVPLLLTMQDALTDRWQKSTIAPIES